MANRTNAPLDPTRVTARCGTGKHGWCIGRVYSWPEEAPTARLIDCECGCGCSPRVAVTRPGAARTRTRQLAARAARRKPRTAEQDAD